MHVMMTFRFLRARLSWFEWVTVWIARCIEHRLLSHPHPRRQQSAFTVIAPIYDLRPLPCDIPLSLLSEVHSPGVSRGLEAHPKGVTQYTNRLF